jgi:hypothetical protein
MRNVRRIARSRHGLERLCSRQVLADWYLPGSIPLQSTRKGTYHSLWLSHDTFSDLWHPHSPSGGVSVQLEDGSSLPFGASPHGNPTRMRVSCLYFEAFTARDTAGARSYMNKLFGKTTSMTNEQRRDKEQ